MNRYTAIGILFFAALLEAGGDAIVRVGLRTQVPWLRHLLFLAGGVVLFAYGWTVNAPPWNFGRLIGLYIVCFFLAAQAVSWIGFGERPSIALIIGGGFILAGGVIIALANA
jgi:small multidrug resistance family-3 protein